MSTSASDRYLNWVQRWLPMPFSIAAVLTVLVLLLALLFGRPPSAEGPRVIGVLAAWEAGVWQSGGLVFTLQMMLILVLGHSLALSPPAQKLIQRLLVFCRDSASSAATVALVAMLAAYVNWGLGLVLGAIFARAAGEHAQRQGRSLNYPLVGAAGYLGLMVWHGGLSGSAPLTVNSPGHNLEATVGLIPLHATLGSSMNLVAIALTLLCLPALFWFLGKRGEDKAFVLPQPGSAATGTALLPSEAAESTAPAESQAHVLDHARWAAWTLAALFVVASIMRLSQGDAFWSLRWLTLNWINGFLFGMGLLLHGSFSRFVAAVDEAMPGAAGIAVQFPLYFGIMGVMNECGLIALLADGFVKLSSPQTFPLLGMLSAGIVNVFVPSGGGQWQVQGPILLDAARQLGVPDWKTVMALAYGDQLTNMLQPFWALPLLGITGLQAREILPYTLIALLAGLGIFAAVLLLF